jgi:hypothetical protein
LQRPDYRHHPGGVIHAGKRLLGHPLVGDFGHEHPAVLHEEKIDLDLGIQQR